jgi:hypothetical protein
MAGVIFNSWFTYFANVWLVSKYIGYNWKTQLINLLPATLASLCFGLFSYFSVSMLNLNLYADGALKMVVFVILYMSWSHFMQPEAYTYTKGIVMPMLTKYKKKSTR